MKPKVASFCSGCSIAMLRRALTWFRKEPAMKVAKKTVTTYAQQPPFCCKLPS